MYLTRMYLNGRRRQTMRFLRDPQAMHAAVESAFPPDSDEQNSRLLWRIDTTQTDTKLFIVSSRVPSLEHVQEQAGWDTEATWETKSYDQLLTRLMRGQRYGFRLTANPVHTVTGDDGVKRKLAHVTVAQQLAWLGDRASTLGVQFLGSDQEPPAADDALVDVEPSQGPHVAEGIKVSARETLRFRRGQHQVTLARAQFDGAFEVVDVEQLRDVLVNGVGRGKAYGCGLMTLAPLRGTGL